MTDNIASFFLSFSHYTTIVPIILIGYIWVDREIFYHAICLLITSIIINFALKITFKIPLSPLLNIEGYAFPSGHMNASTTFYGWLTFKTKNLKIKALLISILIGIGWGLKYFGYHDYYDILGGVFFALTFLYLYYLMSLYNLKVLSGLIFTIITISMIYIYFRHKLLSSNLWMLYYALIGFMASENIFKSNGSLALKSKIFATILCLTSTFIFKNFFLNILPLYLHELQWFVIGFIIPLSPYIAKRISEKNV